MKRKNDRSLGWFVFYALGSGAVMLGLLTIVIPGLLAALLVGAILVVALVVRGIGPAAAGVISGPSLPLLFVAWLDRRGPGGLHCGADSCSESPSPVPWLVAAVVFLASGLVLFVVLRRVARPTASTQGPPSPPAAQGMTYPAPPFSPPPGPVEGTQPPR